MFDDHISANPCEDNLCYFCNFEDSKDLDLDVIPDILRYGVCLECIFWIISEVISIVGYKELKLAIIKTMVSCANCDGVQTPCDKFISLAIWHFRTYGEGLEIVEALYVGTHEYKMCSLTQVSEDLVVEFSSSLFKFEEEEMEE